MDRAFLSSKHSAGLSYTDYVKTGNAKQVENWTKFHGSVSLTAGQRGLISSFARKMNVLVVSGIWCGDCVQQVPILGKIAEANPDKIDLRIVDRDAHLDLQEKVRICAGNRVPVALFMAEDHELCGWFGDRTLSRYRAVTARQLGPACPLPGAAVDKDEVAACVQDWVDQFERIHLMLRISARLRKLHND